MVCGSPNPDERHDEPRFVFSFTFLLSHLPQEPTGWTSFRISRKFSWRMSHINHQASFRGQSFDKNQDESAVKGSSSKPQGILINNLHLSHCYWEGGPHPKYTVPFANGWFSRVPVAKLSKLVATWILEGSLRQFFAPKNNRNLRKKRKRKKNTKYDKCVCLYMIYKYTYTIIYVTPKIHQNSTRAKPCDMLHLTSLSLSQKPSKLGSVLMRCLAANMCVVATWLVTFFWGREYVVMLKNRTVICI